MASGGTRMDDRYSIDSDADGALTSTWWRLCSRTNGYINVHRPNVVGDTYTYDYVHVEPNSDAWLNACQRIFNGERKHKGDVKCPREPQLLLSTRPFFHPTDS